MKVKKLTGLVLATAAAGLFAGVNVEAADKNEAKVMCEGANACKGQSACHTAANACQGMNSCKGKGMLVLTEKECEAAKAAVGKAKKS